MSEESEKKQMAMTVKAVGWDKEVVRGYIRLVRFADNQTTKASKIDGRIAEVIASDSKTGILTLRVLKFNSIDETNELFPKPLEMHFSNCVPYGQRTS